MKHVSSRPTCCNGLGVKIKLCYQLLNIPSKQLLKLGMNIAYSILLFFHLFKTINGDLQDYMSNRQMNTSWSMPHTFLAVKGGTMEEISKSIR